ncbi:MAG: tRNA (cytidine(34)-2'-O)-methyltransferase [Planctomycetes bacterium]|nr:tRNA (cytidine(34)-2'-O)-methyltransferase [Planctomycetota bacterium]
MDIVLVHPEIPHNTGCIARLAAATGRTLHLIEPLGYSLEDRYLKRAGLDYWPLVDLVVHASWSHALDSLAKNGRRPIGERLQLFTARGGTSLFETEFQSDDVLVFGCESQGLATEIVQAYPLQRVYVPIRAQVRSLNLASVVCLATYTAMVRAGLALPANDGGYDAHPRARENVRPIQRARRTNIDG